MAGLFEKTDSLVSKGVMGAARWGGFAEVCEGKLAPPSLYGADFDFSPFAPVLLPLPPGLLPPCPFSPSTYFSTRSGLRELAVRCA